MTVSPPHGPIYEETEFWYDTQEKAILYEVNIEPRQGQAEADHARTGERGHLSSHDRSFHWHHQPHGIYLVDKGTDEYLGGTNLANTELVIRLWCEVERNEQPTNSPFRRPPLLPVPKALALFIVEKRAEMYMNESITQALVLLQTYLTAKIIPPVPSPAC